MGRTPHIAVAAVASLDDEAVAQQALERVGIGHLRDRSFDEVSGGERQLILVARALYQEARLLIMDEPTASLDYGNQIRILQIVNELRQRGYGIVMTAQNPDHAFLSATRVAILDSGRLTAVGTPEEVVTSERLSALYQTPIRVVTTTLDDASGAVVRACIPLM